MVRAMWVMCVGVLASVILAGCASSGDVGKVNERLGSLEEKVAADLKASAVSVKKTEEGISAADARLGDMEKKVEGKLSAVEAKLSNMQRLLKAIGDDMKKLSDDVAAYRATTDTDLQALTKRLEKTEADSAEASKQLPIVKAEISKFNAQFKEMSAAVNAAQALTKKNLENARDIYKMQFLALEEILQKLDKTEKPKKTPAPKE
jgi:tetrahydromethanopterin S-methyltransferase subunit G